jgi:hypothetical protein
MSISLCARNGYEKMTGLYTSRVDVHARYFNVLISKNIEDLYIFE